jgi:hypothetical protein
MITRMTSFLRLSVDKVSKIHLFILDIALNLLCLGVRLVASGVNGGRLRMKPCLLALHHFLHIILMFMLFVHS